MIWNVWGGGRSPTSVLADTRYDVEGSAIAPSFGAGAFGAGHLRVKDGNGPQAYPGRPSPTWAVRGNIAVLSSLSDLSHKTNRPRDQSYNNKERGDPEIMYVL